MKNKIIWKNKKTKGSANWEYFRKIRYDYQIKLLQATDNGTEKYTSLVIEKNINKNKHSRKINKNKYESIVASVW